MRIALDIETNKAHDTIWLCCTYDIDTKEVRTWTEPESFLQFIKDASLIVAHNGIGFDYPKLNSIWKAKITIKTIADTLIMSRLANPSREGRHSLKNLANLVGRTKKEFDDFDQGLSQTMIDYCIEDTIICGELYLYLSKELEEFSQKSIDLEHRTAMIVAQQERNGFLLDVPYAMSLLSEWKVTMSNMKEELQAIFPPIVTERWSEKTGKRLKDDVEVFNVGSRQQVAKRLQSLGWVPKDFTETGEVKVDESILESLEYPEAKRVLEYLTLQKRVSQVSSWIDAVKNDQRIHGEVITNGAISGRATHNSPNVAQVPNLDALYGKECRSCWTVPKGYKLVGIDLSQLELRCLAHYMRDDDYTKELLEGDIHIKNQIAAGLPDRAAAKTFIFATIYGAGPTKIGSIVGGGVKEGKKILDKFYKAIPSLEQLQEKVARIASCGSLPGLDGRRLLIRHEHAALNTLLQGAGAIISKQWIINCDNQIRSLGFDAKQVAWVHDELQFEVREEQAEEFGIMAVHAARDVAVHFDLRCPLDAEYHIGSNWAESH